MNVFNPAALHETERFLRLILPPQGWYCAAVFKPGRSAPKHHWFKTVEEMAAFMLEQDAAGNTVYHACASYKKPTGRTKDNVHQIASLWHDVEGKDYGNDQDETLSEAEKNKARCDRAIQAVAIFSHAAGLPLSAANKSGHGMHCYWRMEKPLSREEWQRYAERFKALSREKGLKFDPVRTADAASILRPPGTHNRKNGAVVPVSLIGLDENAAISLSQLPRSDKPARKAKGKAPAVEEPPAELPPYLARIPILKGADIPDEALYPSEPADANAIADRCAQMRAMRDKRGKLIEPLWRANIINLSNCKDGNEIAHEWSKGDERYNPEETQKKIDRGKADIAAPITCEFFQGNDPEQKCKGCSFRDKITTPVQLGRDPWKRVAVEYPPPKPAEAPSATIEAPAVQAAAPEPASSEAKQPDTQAEIIQQINQAQADAASAPPPTQAKGRAQILVAAGDLPRVVDECELALENAGVEIYDWGRELAAPVVETVDATSGGSTLAPRFHNFTASSLKDLLDTHILFTQFDGRNKKIKPMDAPEEVARRLLTRPDAGRSRSPVVEGFISTPTLRPDGSLLDKRGYDPKTKLYLALDPNFKLPPLIENPTREDALAALAFIDELLDEFPFEGPADRSVALSMILTATLRGSMGVVPLHAIKAHQSGTGKGYLTNTVAAVATGLKCSTINAGVDAEELEKRLGGLLLKGAPLFSLDNCNRELGGEFLNTVISEGEVEIRPLGKSTITKCQCKPTIFANGNNIRLAGDLARRSLLCRLDAKEEHPETRVFKREPFGMVLANRAAYVAAMLTVARAWQLARDQGEDVSCTPLAGFGQWSDRVRKPLIWLGRADPVKSQEVIRAFDPERNQLRDLFANWPHNDPQASDGFTAAEFIDLVNRGASLSTGPNAERSVQFRELHALLVSVASSNGRDISPLKLANWFAHKEGHVIEGWRLMVKRVTGRSSRYVLEAV